MANPLQPQLINADEIRDILKEVPISFEMEHIGEVKTLLVYLPIKDGSSDCSVFFQKVKEAILYNFVFSCSEVEKKLGVKSKLNPEQLFDKAVRKLSKHTAQGELGELILFTLLDVYFEAPKLLSKVSMKTNRKMPVFGADAVHGQFDNGEFRLYLGESKLHEDFKGAATKAAASIQTAKDKYVEEFDLLDSYMDFPNIDKKIEKELLDYLDPFSDNDLTDVIKSPCFIGFTEPSIISTSVSESDFIEKYTELAQDYVADFFTKISNKEIDIDEVTLLMLPFTSVEDLVKQFIAYMEIQE